MNYEKGTWAWACQMMLEGKTVQRKGWQLRLKTGLMHMKSTRGTSWGTNICLVRKDLTATNWEIVE